ncbi:hypothetical protein SAMN05444395_109106 [Flavobacterium fryxellicola]|uniref:DUF1735 domain-containing protein n=1 Tax=Flavobacterium fryxellicola TaxID=249352 RepID=A0A167U5K4_9FLAO|nr:hypothetical protein [Flavobacterium fryxellicola]OAB25273.1 hypothetical protein FBFR_14890 [Flavobacterium fryxellicola]SHN75479.1 hypothetical protein SAMN05444395_109106 [Flavobacterium fryxellicola]
MKKLKTVTGIALMAILGFTSCQNEIDDVQGENPNTNSANSTTTSNLKRTSMYDGSFDDFLDGASCSSILLPVSAKVNGVQVSIFSQLDYQQVLSIFGQLNNDQDTVVLQFPFKVKLSNYTEANVTNQTEYNAILNACATAEASGQGAISSVNISFPITILTYNLSLQQTGSIVITSEEQLYTYMSNVSSSELYSVNYPISATIADGTKMTISSDAELQAAINASLKTEATMAEAAQNSKKLETILVNGKFKVDSFVSAGVNSANNYKDFTIDFANNLSVTAVNLLSSTVNGTYAVSSELSVFLKLNFSGNATFILLNNTWKVTSFTATTITLQSATNAAVTVVLKQI